ncbi:hypothetical protein IFR04_014615 [Cadophora malorum]|uniref:Heterokaryon incompatibility domain-containing protein n=1 Tax=Cadophora malorum TaxID=108018 RepID=A0A8H7T4I9_9HELO|nr:hypothetical protein IFR04_014615 [Cadophora malorum]
MSGLCRAYQVLSFDDSREGGYEYEDIFGKKSLHHAKDPNGMAIWIRLDYNQHDELPEMPRMAASAEAGCQICDLMTTSIQRDLQVRVEREPTEWSGGSVDVVSLSYAFTKHHRVYDKESELAYPYYLLGLVFECLQARFADLKITLPDGSVYLRTVAFRIEALPGSRATWLNITSPPCSDALCPENISILGSEIDNCVEKCSHSHNGNIFVPTRLVDLRDRHTPRLVEFGDHNPRGDTELKHIKYAALSYCWGSPSEAISMLKTEKQSLRSRRSGIAIT